MPKLLLNNQKKLGLLTETDVLVESKSTEPNGDLPDIRSLPKIMFRTQKLEGVRAKKKIIISDWSLPYLVNHLDGLLADFHLLFEKLLEGGFSIYAMQENGLVEIHDKQDLAKALIDIPAATREQIKNALNDKTIASDNAVILDYFVLRQLIAKIDHINYTSINNSEYNTIDPVNYSHPYMISNRDLSYINKKMFEDMLATLRGVELDGFEINITDRINEEFIKRIIQEHPEANKLSLVIKEGNKNRIINNLKKLKDLIPTYKIISLNSENSELMCKDLNGFDFSKIERINLKRHVDVNEIIGVNNHNIKEAQIYGLEDWAFSFPNIKNLDLGIYSNNPKRIESLINLLNSKIKLGKLSIFLGSLSNSKESRSKIVQDIISKIKQTKCEVGCLAIKVNDNCGEEVILAKEIVSQLAPHLKELRLNMHQYDDKTIIPAFDNIKFPKLKSLALRNSHKSEFNFFSQILKNAEQVEVLSIEPCESNSDPFMALADLPPLNKLKKCYFKGYTTSQFKEITEALSRVAPNIKFSHYENDSRSYPDSLQRPSYLEVDIHDDIDFHDVVMNVTNETKFLEISLYEKVSYKKSHLDNVKRTFPLIEKLDLYISKLDMSQDEFNEFLKGLLKLFPNIKYLKLRIINKDGSVIEVDKTLSMFLSQFKNLKQIKLNIYDTPLPFVKAVHPHVDDEDVTEKYFTGLTFKRQKKERDKSALLINKSAFIQSSEPVDASLSTNSSKVLDVKHEEVKSEGHLTSQPVLKAKTDKDNYSLDSETIENPNRVHNVTQYFLPKTNPKLNASPSSFRLSFYPKIHITEDDVSLIPGQSNAFNIKPIKSLSEADFANAVKKYEDNSENYCVDTMMLLDHDTWVRLPSKNPAEKIQIVDKDIALGYSAEEQCYFVKLADKVDDAIKVVPIQYTLQSRPIVKDWKINESYFAKSKSGTSIFQHLDLKIEDKLKLVPHKGFEKKFKKIQKLPLSKKIAELIAFFTYKDFNSEQTDPTLKGKSLLNELMHKRKGSCRHRAILFMALADLLGIKAIAVGNDCHLFIEVFENGMRYTVDLGGFDAKLNVTIAPSASVQPVVITKKINSKPIIDVQTQPTDFNNYLKRITQKLAQQKLHKRNALIMLNSESDILRFHAAMLNNLKERKYFYLDDLSEVTDKQLLVTNDKKYKIAASQLAEFLKSAKPGDVIMVNWSQFKSEHIGFNTMMDDDRVLLDMPIPPGVIVCGIIDKNNRHKLGEDFYSRFRLRELAPPITDLPNVEFPQAKVPLNKKILPINLHGGEDWEKELLGIINIKKTQFSAIYGQLVQAIEQGYQGIELINAPWGFRPFAVFMTELKNRGSFEFQGKPYYFPKDFQFINSGENYDFTGNFSIERQSQANANQWEYALNSQTYPRFFNNYCSEEDRFKELPGWLVKDSTLSILVTSQLTQGQWSRILSVAKNLNCQLRFIVPDQIVLPEKMLLNASLQPKIINSAKAIENDIKSENPPGSVRYIQTNDIAYTVATLENEKKQHIISISEEMTFNDVWETLSSEGLNDGGLQFTSKFSDLWTWLKKGETVILKGHFSTELASRMESLFAEKKYLWMNGQKQDLNGRLVIITDKKDCFVAAKPEIKTVTSDDCWKELEKHYSKPSCELLKKEKSSLANNYAQLNTVLHSLSTAPMRHPLRSLALLDERPEEVLKKIKTDSLASHVKHLEIKTDDVVKRRLLKMDKMLEQSPYVFMVGPSGTGKSTLVLSKLKAFYKKELQQEAKVYNGMEQVEQWAGQFDKTKKHVLFIDEANLEKNGKFDIFEGLFDDPPGILLHGKWYPIGSHQKVIFAGNYSFYAGRHQHDLFKSHGSVMLYNEFPMPFLKNCVIQPVLKDALPAISERDLNSIGEFLISVYQNYKLLKARSLFTTRNLHAICLRLGVLVNEKQDITKKAQYVVYKELEGLLNEAELKVMVEKLHLPEKECKDFNDQLDARAASAFDSKDFVLTKSRHPLVSMLTEELQTRALRMKTPGLFDYGTRGETIEGSPGVGKSFVVKEFFKMNGFIEVNLDTVDTPEILAAKEKGKVFYHLTPTKPERMLKTLEKAFHEGAIVIIDEINTIALERVLNAYLMGRDLLGESAKRDGFYIVGTQNPITFAGRKGLSGAFDNRFRKKIIPDYPAKELEDILVKRGTPRVDAGKRVDDFMKLKDESLFPPMLRDLWATCAA